MLNLLSSRFDAQPCEPRQGMPWAPPSAGVPFPAPDSLPSSSAQGWHGRVTPEAQARLYLDILEESDYAQRVAPVVGTDYHDVLDIGAGNGVLTRRCLARPARWLAVEPNQAMGAALAALRPGLDMQGIDLTHLPLCWEALPPTVAAETVFAFNIGATHHGAGTLFDSLAGRCQRAMVWVVPAQRGPSTFCLAGFLPPELHGADMTPAHERTLAALSAEQQPNRIDFVDWQCRLCFPSRAAAAAHFLDRLNLESDSAGGRAVVDYLGSRVDPGSEAVRIACAKRSAVMFWTF